MTYGVVYDNFLLYTDFPRKGIYQVDIESGNHTLLEVQNINHDIPLGVDYDPVEQNVYWVDRGPSDNIFGKKWIRKHPLGGGSTTSKALSDSELT